jgi:hypothetical protein
MWCSQNFVSAHTNASLLMKLDLEKTSTEKAKGIWLSADHLSAQYRTKPLDPTTHSAANA